MADVARLLEPAPSDEKQAQQALGRNIQFNQPDVEALAFVTRDFPVTEDKFNEMRGSREWVSLQVCLLGVGQAGFSKVPYVSSKKKGEKEDNQKKLYEDCTGETMGTTFFSFLKGKTNKDRGERIEQCEVEDGATQTCKATVRSGQCLSAFMRSDIYTESKFFVDDYEARWSAAKDGVLKKHSFVYLQLSSQNVEQAKKGNLVKIKRMKIITDAQSVAGALMHRFPTSFTQFDDIMREGQENTAINKQIYSGNNTFCALTPQPTAFISQGGGGEYFVCSKIGVHGVEDRKLPAHVLYSATGSKDPERACKIGSIALALGAMRFVVASNTRQDVIMGDTESWAFEAVLAHLDTNTLFSLPEISQHDLLSTPGEEWHAAKGQILMSLVGKRLSWTHKDKLVRLESGDLRMVVFTVACEKRTVQPSDSKAWNGESSRLLADGCAGTFHKLSIHFATPGVAWNHIMTFNSACATPIMTMQLFPDFMSTNTSTKRPRYLQSDARDDFSDMEDVEVMGVEQLDQLRQSKRPRVSFEQEAEIDHVLPIAGDDLGEGSETSSSVAEEGE